jgi:hypothetical protein
MNFIISKEQDFYKLFIILFFFVLIIKALFKIQNLLLH